MAMTRSIELRTEIPGPRSREILERKAARRRRAARRSTFPIVAPRRAARTLTDVDGNTFIDFTGGVGCLNVGHSHPQVVAAAQEQLARFSHTDFTIVPYEVYVDARRAAAASSRRSRGPAKAAFFNAGTEAVENAVKFARAYTGRPAVIALRGRLPRPDAALADADLEDASVQGGPRAVRARGLPRAVPERLPRADAPPRRSRRSSARFGHAGRGRERRRDRRRAGAGRGRLRRRAAGVPRTACAGSATTTGSCSSSTRCRPASARTGRFFAIEHYDVEPDLITIAKSIAGGLPLSGVLGKAEIMDAPGDSRGRRHLRRQPGRAGGRARRARRVRGGGPDRARGAAIGETIRARMQAWQERWDAIGDVRGLGAMLAIELVHDRETKNPAPELATSGRRGSCRPRAAAAQGRDLLELHPRARPARHLRRRARRGARRLGTGARRLLGLAPPVDGHN